MIFMIEAPAVLLIGSVPYMDPDHLGRLWLRSWAAGFGPHGMSARTVLGDK